MEIVGHYQRPTTKSLVGIHIPWFVSIPLLGLTGITIVVMGVIMAAHHELSNPFSAFDDLFGSEARQAALARGFTCRESGFPAGASQEPRLPG